MTQRHKQALRYGAWTLLLGMLALPALAQRPYGDHGRYHNNRYPGRNSYVASAYDQGYQAGEADYRYGRNYSVRAALISNAGLGMISRDYRDSFEQGYRDGYDGTTGDYRGQRDRRDRGGWRGRGRGRDENGDYRDEDRHDRGRHVGWYGRDRNRGDDQGEDENDDD